MCGNVAGGFLVSEFDCIGGDFEVFCPGLLRAERERWP